MQPSTARLTFIDALRGFAALWVAFFHFSFNWYKPLEQGPKIAGGIVRYLYECVMWHGGLGVEIFFVISGFVIAHTLLKATPSPRFVGNFILRRSIRLDPPYWSTIILALTCGWLSHWLLRDSAVYLPRQWWEIPASMFYLQDLLQYRAIVGVAWTLCLEVQFYLFFVLAWAILAAVCATWRLSENHASNLRLAGFVLLGFYSLLVRFKFLPLPWPGLFVQYWYLFQLGVFACWALTGRIRGGGFILYALMAASFLFFKWDKETFAGLCISGLIFGVGRANHLHDWLNFRPLQYFGRISYSLYLVHTIVGVRIVNWMWRLTNHNASFLTLLAFVALALAASVVVAHLLWRFVEKPSVELAKRLKWQPAVASAKPQGLRAAA